MSDDATHAFDRAMSELRTLRDELRVKAHLAGKDLEDLLDRHQGTFDGIESRIEGAVDALEAHAPDVKASAQLLLDEVRKGFADARSRLEQG